MDNFVYDFPLRLQFLLTLVRGIAITSIPLFFTFTLFFHHTHSCPMWNFLIFPVHSFFPYILHFNSCPCSAEYSKVVKGFIWPLVLAVIAVLSPPRNLVLQYFSFLFLISPHAFRSFQLLLKVMPPFNSLNANI